MPSTPSSPTSAPPSRPTWPTAPACRAELADHLEAASYLVLHGRARPRRALGTDRRLRWRSRRRRCGWRWCSPAPVGFAPAGRWRWTLAAAAAVILVVMSVALVRQRGQIDDLHHSRWPPPLARSARQAMADPAGQHLTLTSPSGAS